MINIKRKYIVLNNYFSIFPEEFDTHFVLQKTMETRDEQNRTRVKSGNLSLSTVHHPTHAYTQYSVELCSNMKQSSVVKVSPTMSCSESDTSYETV